MSSTAQSFPPGPWSPTIDGETVSFVFNQDRIHVTIRFAEKSQLLPVIKNILVSNGYPEGEQTNYDDTKNKVSVLTVDNVGNFEWFKSFVTRELENNKHTVAEEHFEELLSSNAALPEAMIDLSSIIAGQSPAETLVAKIEAELQGWPGQAPWNDEERAKITKIVSDHLSKSGPAIG